MKKLFIFSLLPLLAHLQAAKAHETGLASMHDWKQEGGRRICMTDHFHDGFGTGKTRKEAEKAARAAWVSFTVFEYGSAWGDYKLAAGGTMECAEQSQLWSCATSARPCKRQGKAPGPSKAASR